MEQNKNQLPLGTWDRIEATDTSKEKIKFDINISRTLVFVSPDAQKHTGEDGRAYYSFEVEENKVSKVLNTSAWYLLRALKAVKGNGTLSGKLVKITKVMVKGKQTFNVELLGE